MRYCSSGIQKNTLYCRLRHKQHHSSVTVPFTMTLRLYPVHVLVLIVKMDLFLIGSWNWFVDLFSSAVLQVWLQRDVIQLHILSGASRTAAGFLSFLRGFAGLWCIIKCCSLLLRCLESDSIIVVKFTQMLDSPPGFILTLCLPSSSRKLRLFRLFFCLLVSWAGHSTQWPSTHFLYLFKKSYIASAETLYWSMKIISQWICMERVRNCFCPIWFCLVFSI